MKNTNPGDRKELVQLMRERHPVDWSLFEPRRYSTPAGYTTPTTLACVMLGTKIGVERYPDNENVCAQLTYQVGINLAKHGMPVYFVARDFLDAAVLTRPPADTKLEDLLMPMPAFTLAIPEEFSHRHLGIHVPFINVSLMRKGRHNKVGLEGDMIIVVFSAFPQGAGSLDSAEYFASLPLSGLVSEVSSIGNAEIEEYVPPGYTSSFIETAVARSNAGIGALLGGPEGESKMMEKVGNLVVKVLMMLTAKPDFAESGEITIDRPGKIKGGKIVRDALWAPRWIGRSYVLPCRQHNGGTHASPIFHWRRAHMHWVRYGAGKTEKKLMRYEMVSVNLDTGEKKT